MSKHRPILLVDVDGVLNPFAADTCPDGFAEHYLFGDAEAVRVCVQHGDWLRELAAEYELAWVSAWREQANRLLGPLLGLPPLPIVPLPPAPFPPDAKLDPVSRYVGDRPVAWLDDDIRDAARAWRDRRPAPTLLVDVDPRVGMTRAHVDHLVRWARQVPYPLIGPVDG